ncbi:hypothetical protein DM02DRAFT_652280 [Periconia macrospinosa]|uniref:Uncharacterized protein n=1 Tax=Periconia macrospinosa TaxID=97972 RepID=A0A2V1E0L3_9PLEO|nr:hypothetical protein DM02DRAFT_652280 [Periconia macrospinosa]
MVLSKRYCVEYVDGTIECFRDGFWYSSTGIIIKWAILAGFFLFFVAWFVGGYIHAKRRMKKGKPLLAYHRWLVSYGERRKYGQTPQNSYRFYAQQPYGQALPQQQQQQPYTQRADGTWPEPPPMYTPGKPDQQGTEMPQYGMPPPPPPMGQQQYGPPPTIQDVEAQQQQQQQQLPPRPQQAKLAVGKMFAKFGRK